MNDETNVRMFRPRERNEPSPQMVSSIEPPAPPPPRNTRRVTIVVFLVLCWVGLIAMLAKPTKGTGESTKLSLTLNEIAQQAKNGGIRGCSPSDIKVKSFRPRWESVSDYRHLQGVAALTNTCNIPVIVQVQITGLSATGEPLAAYEWWATGTRNIAPGDHTIPLVPGIKYDPAIKSFTLEPIDVKQWNGN